MKNKNQKMKTLMLKKSDQQLKKYIEDNCDLDGWYVDQKGNIFLYPKNNDEKKRILDKKTSSKEREK